MEELQRTVQTGNSLLRRKEEQLQQLENSMSEEVREPVRALEIFCVWERANCSPPNLVEASLSFSWHHIYRKRQTVGSKTGRETDHLLHHQFWTMSPE